VSPNIRAAVSQAINGEIESFSGVEKYKLGTGRNRENPFLSPRYTITGETEITRYPVLMEKRGRV